MAINCAGWLQRWEPLLGQKTALLDLGNDRHISYAELARQSRRAAALLRRDFGVRPGDRVALLGLNRNEHVVLFFAAARLGAVLVPINWRLAADEVSFVLSDCTPTLLCLGEDARERVGHVEARQWRGATLDLDDPGPEGFAARMASGAEDADLFDAEEKTPLMLLYTSGTTGRPKGAVLTHGTITWNSINTGIGWDLRQDDSTLTHTPFFHTGGWNVLTLPLLHRGGTVVLARKFDPAQAVRAVARYRLSVLFAVPTMFQMMLDSGELARADLTSVRFFISGGQACPVPLIEAYQKFGIVFKQGYGLTEVGPNCFVLHERDAVRKAGSVGFPVLHLETRLALADRVVERGEVGELQLRGPTVCAGYFNNPEATRSAFTADGWFATGDLFRQDEEGYHFVVGRLKEMYKSGGENVYPAEVERVLYEIPEVIEAAVVGVPDPKWGEVGHAFVALRQPGPDEAAILEHCRSKLARFKIPRAVTVLAELPKGSSGKIHKAALREQALRGA
jgi:fatty-acyl-CoA synthase